MTTPENQGGEEAPKAPDAAETIQVLRTPFGYFSQERNGFVPSPAFLVAVRSYVLEPTGVTVLVNVPTRAKLLCVRPSLRGPTFQLDALVPVEEANVDVLQIVFVGIGESLPLQDFRLTPIPGGPLEREGKLVHPFLVENVARRLAQLTQEPW